MSQFKGLLLMAVAAVFLVGCGGSGPGVKKGDKLVVSETLPRERIGMEYSEGVTDGTYKEIPKGTVLEVVITPKVGASGVEVIPVEVEGKKDPEEVQHFFVPERFSNREGFLGYSLVLKNEYIGTKVNKAE